MSEVKKVDLFIPRGSSVDEPNVIISVNGKNYVLPKGKTSKVPVFVKYEYERSIRAKEAMDVRAAEMVESSRTGKESCRRVIQGGASMLPSFLVGGKENDHSGSN